MSPTSPRSVTATFAILAAAALMLGCSAPTGDTGQRTAGAASESAIALRTPSGVDTPPTTPSATEEPRLSSAGRPMRAQLSIPEIGVTDLDVVPYRGWTDDGPGTEIQDNGLAASPHGRRGGTGPGGIGNFQVTAHRLSSTAAFLRLPELVRGDQVQVRTEDATYVYRITRTRQTSFRSPASLRAQRAAVPGRPGQEATRAMITLSTCATVEDRAAGNHWSDELGNPEHRIDKIGILVAVRPELGQIP